jgi:hypothetical protein
MAENKPPACPTRVYYQSGKNMNFADASNFDQKYHLAMRRRLNHGLHTWGIVWGLHVSLPLPVNGRVDAVKVSKGVAIDKDGKEIVLLSDYEVAIDPGPEAGKTYYITVEQREQGFNEEGDEKKARIAELPFFGFSSTLPDASDEKAGKQLVLASVVRTSTGFKGEPGESERSPYTGQFGSLTFKDEKVADRTKWPKLTWVPAAQTILATLKNADLRVTRDGVRDLLLGVDSTAAFLSTRGGDFQLRTGDGTNNAPRLVVDKDGKVFVGKGTPPQDYTFCISADASVNTFANIKNSDHELLVGVNTRQALLFAAKSSDLVLGTNLEPRLAITKDGNVGIGTIVDATDPEPNVNKKKKIPLLPTKAKVQVDGMVGKTVALFGGRQGVSVMDDDPAIGFNCSFDKEFEPVSRNDYSGILQHSKSDGSFSFGSARGSSTGAGPGWKLDLSNRALTIKPEGKLTVSGAAAELTIIGPDTGTYANIKNGKHELRLGVDDKATILSAATKSELQLRTGEGANNSARLTVKADGTVHFYTNYDGRFPDYKDTVAAKQNNVASGLAIGWNGLGATGETDFVNFPGNGPGGFAFFFRNRDGTVPKKSGTSEDDTRVATRIFRGGRLEVDGTDAQLSFKSRSGSGGRYAWYSPDGNSARLWMETTRDLLTITKDGKVGVGAETPSGNLTISVPSPSEPANPHSPAYANIKNGKHELRLGVDDKATILSAVTNSDLELRTGEGANNAARLTIKADGTLDVRGTTHFMIDYNGNFPSYGSEMGKGGLAIGWNGGGKGETNLVNFPGDGSGGFSFVFAKKDGSINSAPMVIDGAGKVGIGTGASALNALLDVNGKIRANSGQIGSATIDRDGILTSPAWNVSSHELSGDAFLTVPFTSHGGSFVFFLSLTVRCDRPKSTVIINITISNNKQVVESWRRKMYADVAGYVSFQTVVLIPQKRLAAEEMNINVQNIILADEDDRAVRGWGVDKNCGIAFQILELPF